MALLKAMRQDDGVVTSYHRILYVQQLINKRTSIAVLSYIDEAARNYELENPLQPIYKQSITHEIDYAENMTIEAAYDYLKTLPQFEESKDI